MENLNSYKLSIECKSILLPLLTIGQMVDLLGDRILRMDRKLDGWWLRGMSGTESVEWELCDALWEMLIKEKL